MSILKLNEVAAPTAPSAGQHRLYYDSTDKVLKVKNSDGSCGTLGDIGRIGNYLANPEFRFLQRQVPGTLTTYSNTTGRTYGADRWGITNENASAQIARVDTIAAVESGLAARYYAKLLKLTSTGKIIVSQVLEGASTAALRGRTVRVQAKAKNSVGSHTLRIALLYLTSSGTVDTMPATFASAFGAASTDPTWGTNLTAITPNSANSNSSIVGNGLTCVLTSSWLRFGGTFTVPTTAQNLVVVVFTDDRPVANDVFFLSEVGLFEGDDERVHLPRSSDEELSACQRFCCKTFNIDTGPVQSAGVNTGEFRWGALIAGATIQRGPTYCFPVPMRAAPTATGFNPAAGSVEVRDITGAVNCTSTSITGLTERGCYVTCTGVAITTAVGNHLGLHMLFEAEL